MFYWKVNNLPWPQNLLGAVFGEADLENYPDDILPCIEYVLKSLDPREAHILRMRFESGSTLAATGSTMGLTVERVRQIQKRAIARLGTTYRGLLRKGLRGLIVEAEDRGRGMGIELGKKQGTEEALKMIREKGDLRDMQLDDLGLSVRARNCLRRAGYETIGDVLKVLPSELLKTRNLGMIAYSEIVYTLKRLGFDMSNHYELIPLSRRPDSY